MKEIEIKNNKIIEELEDITNNITSDTKINYSSNSISIENPNKIFLLSLDILTELEIKKINEIVFSKFMESIVNMANLRGKKMFGFEIKNKYVINFDKPEEILNKKVKELFIGSAQEEIETLIKKEKEKNDIYNTKIFYLCFNENFVEMFMKYLNDDPFITKDKLRIKLEGFDTFEDTFKDYDNKKKEDIKKCIYLFFKIEYQEKISEEDNTQTKQITQNYYDSRKLINNKAIGQSFHTVLKNFVSEKYKIKLFKPTLNALLKYKEEEYNKFYSKNLKFIYSNVRPKKNKENKNYSEPINLALEKELEKKDNRKLNLLLNHGIIINLMKAFINDEKFINITDEYGNEFKLYFINFKTYKDYFRHSSHYDDFKKNFILLLVKIIQTMEKSDKI